MAIYRVVFGIKINTNSKIQSNVEIIVNTDANNENCVEIMSISIHLKPYTMCIKNMNVYYYVN